MKRIKPIPCCHCGTIFRPDKSIRKYCSRRCSTVHRPRASYVAMGKMGGLTAGVTRRARSAQRVSALVAGLSPVRAFWAGRKYGRADMANERRSAYGEGFSAGYEHGWDAATKERKRA